MSKEYLSIGEMARMNGTTVPTLRLYDRLGLLKPRHVDEESGYRYYDIKQNARFDMIQYMKELGMALKEIGALLACEDPLLIKSVLQKKRAQAEENIRRMELQLSAIDRTVEGIERWRKSPGAGATTLEYIPSRRIYSMHTDVNFYDHSIDTYEIILKQLKEELIRRGLPQIYYCNAGTVLPRDDFLALNFVSHKIFVFADANFPLPAETEEIPNDMFACIYLDDFDSEREYAARLLDFCSANGYSPTGDYLCEVLMELSVFESARRSMFLRLQVPVSFENQNKKTPRLELDSNLR